MQIDPYGISNSAMALQAQRLAVSAHNVANLNTEGFEASQVVASEAAGGGVTGRITPTGEPAPLLSRDGVAVALSNTSLVGETVNRVSALRAYQANAAVFRTAQEMDREALDLMA